MRPSSSISGVLVKAVKFTVMIFASSGEDIVLYSNMQTLNAVSFLGGM